MFLESKKLSVFFFQLGKISLDSTFVNLMLSHKFEHNVYNLEYYFVLLYKNIRKVNCSDISYNKLRDSDRKIDSKMVKPSSGNGHLSKMVKPSPSNSHYLFDKATVFSWILTIMPLLV